MINYKIFNWQGKELLRIEADWLSINDKGQIQLFINEQSWPVAVFPDGTLIAESDKIYSRRPFDFVNQKEEAGILKKRNEAIFAEKTKNFQIGDLHDEKLPRGKYHTESNEAHLVKKLEDAYTPAEKELYKEGYRKAGDLITDATKEIQKAKETILSTGNGKLDENQENRVLEQIKEVVLDETKEEERKRKNREYAKEYYKKQREAQGKPYTPKDDHSDSGSENYRPEHTVDLSKLKTQAEKNKEKFTHEAAMKDDFQVPNHVKLDGDEEILDNNDNEENWVWE